jgi:hypothetical protein
MSDIPPPEEAKRANTVSNFVPDIFKAINRFIDYVFAKITVKRGNDNKLMK